VFAVPEFHLVTMETAESILMGAIALALLGLMEAYSIGRSIAGRTGDRVSANAELVSQGLTNAITSFFQCIPGSGSFSRSELNYRAGACTVFAGVINGLVVLAVFVLFARWAVYVPMAALAAVLFVIAAGLIDWRFFLRVRNASRSDAIVFGVTFVATLLLPLQYAVYIGILLNIGLYLNQASRLHLAEMIQTTAGPFLERPIHDRLGNKQVMFLQLEGDLFFAVADELRDRLANLLDGEVRVVIFRLKRTHMMDATVMAVLEWFIREMRRTNRHVILCGVRTDLMTAVKGYGLVDLIGKENVFPAGDNVFSSAKAALNRARELVARSIDLQPIQEELKREDAPTYEI
jgi:sulfate permease, SulP family